MITQFFNNLKYIYKIILSTPKYYYLMFLNILSTLFTFAGIPLLIPALEYLKTDIPSERNLNYMEYVEKVFAYFNIEANFYSVILVAALLLFTGHILLLLTELFSKRVQVKLVTKFTNELITGYYNANWSLIANDQSGRFHSAISREATSAGEMHLFTLRIFTSILQNIAYITLAFFLSPLITSSIVLCFFIIFCINLLYSEKLKKISDKFNNEFISLTSYISALIQNKKFFKTSKNYKSFMTEISEKISSVYKTDWQVNVLLSGLRAFTIMTGTAFLLIIFLTHRLFDIQFTELLVILLVFARLSPQFNSLVDNYNRIVERQPIYNSIKKRIKELNENVEKNGKEKFISGQATKFERVNCSYIKDRPVLKNINIEILPFKTTAIVGSSGSGKSTFLDLFLGLLDPDSGKIYYGKIPHDKLDKNSLRKKVAYVGQETTLLDGSLKHNLTIANNDAKESDINEVCKKARVDQFIGLLPSGLETQIGENGIKLSGGQRQRVALARALLTKPEILILDEATSNLDMETEGYIKEAIKNLTSQLTIIIVAHRLSTVRFSDNLYVLENGIVVENGTFDELIQKKGRLAELDYIQNL